MIFRVYDNLPEGKYGHKFLTWMIWVPPWEGHPSILVNLCKSWRWRWCWHWRWPQDCRCVILAPDPPQQLLSMRSPMYFAAVHEVVQRWVSRPPCGTLEPWGRGRSHSARGPAGHESLASLAAKPRRRNWCFLWPVPLGMKHVSDCVVPGWGLDAFKFIGRCKSKLHAQRLPDSLLSPLCHTAKK